MFTSATQAILRYVELYQLLACPRSIPLGVKKTHVGKTDSRGKWEIIKEEFARLALAFPSTGSIEWWLLVVSIMNNKGSRDRRAYFNRLTQQHFSQYLFERRTAQAYGLLTKTLIARGLLDPQDARVAAAA